MSRKRLCFYAALYLATTIGATAAQAKERVNLIYASISGLFLGTWVAQEAGYFDRENLEVNLIYIQSASTALQAMLAGEAPLALAGGEPVVESGLKGGDAVFVAGISVVPAVHVMAVPEIRSVQDLRGKPVGVTRYGSSTDYAMRQVLRINGLEPVRDVPVLQISGGHRALAAALLKRAVYAATIAPPNSLRAEKGGAKLLIDMAKSGIYFPYSSIISTRSYLKKNRPTVVAFLTGYSEGLKRMVNDKKLSIATLRKHMREEDPEVLETIYKYALDYIVRVPHPTREGIAEVLRQSTDPKAKSMSPESFIDDSIVRELEQKGFYR
ncbi:MAG: ABC transporter substrate-binding protein [Deltaproteobacteria bacterium]|nr:ABC transporter substrate-binding protein [Deltaproteobacteria bacterium]